MKALVSIFFPMVPFFLIFLLLALYRNYHKMKKRKNPFKDKLLRGPGTSLLNRIDELSDRITSDIFSFGTTPLAVYAIFLTQAYFFEVSFSLVSIVPVALIVFFTMLYLGYSTFKNLNLRRNYRLGLDGELYVGQELNCLMHQGYSVFP